VPKPLKFSSLVKDISGINFLTFCQSFLSGFKVIRPFYLNDLPVTQVTNEFLSPLVTGVTSCNV